MKKLKIFIEVKIYTTDEIKELARIANEIRKEHNCDCTLSIKVE